MSKKYGSFFSRESLVFMILNILSITIICLKVIKKIDLYGKGS